MHWACPFPLLSLALALLPAAVRAQTLELLVYANAGVFEATPRGGVTGRGAVVLQRLGEVSGLTLHLQVVPAARALLMTTQQPGHCTVGVPRTPEREPLFRWAGLMASGALVLYARADDPREVNSPEELRGAVIVAQRESMPATWLREHGLPAYEVSDTATGLRMLRAGRVDYWLVNDLAAQRAIQRAEGQAPRPLRNFGQIDLHLACHRALPPATAERLSRGLDQLRRDGELVEFGLR